MWRFKNAEKRRHRGLIWFEDSNIGFEEERELKELRDNRIRQKRRRRMLENAVNNKRAADFRDMVARKEKERFDADHEVRDRNFTKTHQMMKLFEQWGFESEERKRAHEAEADKIDKGNKKDLKDGNFKGRQEGKAAAEEAVRIADFKETQEILAMMRQNGTIAGVNPPAVEERETQMETAINVTLYNRTEAELKNLGKGKDFSWFTVDLRRFRNAEYIKGENIGAKGCRFLARTLRNGACPKLRHLNLQWCRVKRLGGDALVDAFAKNGTKMVLENLNLTMCHIPGSTVRDLGKVLVAGGMQTLTVIDLRQNLIGNEGAQALAHTILARGLRHLQRLYVMQNSIYDLGASALFKSLTTEEIMCPVIENVNIRDNPTSSEWRRSIDPCPIFFQC